MDARSTDPSTGEAVLATPLLRPVHALFGLPFDAVTMDDAVRLVRNAVTTRTRCFLSTPNLNFVVACAEDPTFRGSVLRSDLSVADGMPLVWAARAMRIPLPERVTGSGLFEALRAQHGDRPVRIFFFGGPEGSAAAADAAARVDGEGIVGVGHLAPGFGTVDAMSTRETLAAIDAARPDFLVVALGARKGQQWIERNLPALDVPVVSHLGAVVNIAAGRVRRAPPLWQRLGLEWVWRIREEPELWRRYARDGLMYVRLLVRCVLPAAIDVRRHAPDAQALSRSAIDLSLDDMTARVTLHGPWTSANLEPVRNALARSIATVRTIVVDVSRVGFVDSAFIGLLMLVAGHQSKVDRTLQLQGPDRAFRKRLAHHGATWLLDS